MAKLECLIEKPLSGEWGLDDENGTGIPVLRTTNFTNEGFINYEKIVTRIISSSKLKDKFLRYGDIILEKSGGSEKQPVGRVVFFEGENDRYLFNNFTTVLRVRDNSVINSKYLFYVLFYNYFSGGTKKFQSKTTGLHNLHLTNFIKSVDIPLVSLSQQVKIVKKLDTINSIIAKRKLQLSKLDQLVKARFVEMFGDLEFGTCSCDIMKLKDLCYKISDGVHAKPQYTTTGKPFLSVININKKYVDFNDCKYVSESDYKKMIKSTHPQKGDVLYTKVGATYGIPAYIDTDKEFCIYVSVCLIKPIHEKINSKFLAIQMDMPFIKHQADKRIKGIGVPDLHLNQIREFDIVCPERCQQDNFVSFAQRIDKTKSAVKQSLEKLETLKKSLMQEYFE